MWWKIFLLAFGYAAATGYVNENELLLQQQQQQQQRTQLQTDQQYQQQYFGSERAPGTSLGHIPTGTQNPAEFSLPLARSHSQIPLWANSASAVQKQAPQTQNPAEFSLLSRTNSQTPLIQNSLHRVPLSRNYARPGVPGVILSQNAPIAQATNTVTPPDSTHLPPAPAQAIAEPSAINKANSHEKFSTNLFQTIGPAHLEKNIIYSPISLQTLLALVSIGAEATAAQELQAALQIPSNKSQVAELFQHIVQKQLNSNNAQLIMVNKLFYNYDLVIGEKVESFAKLYFASELQPTQFATPAIAAQNINAWVADATNNRIRDVISPNSLDPRTSAILVNAIYFKAKWAKPFSMTDTLRHDFHRMTQDRVSVEMMYNEETFRWGDFPQLKAKALEMRYQDSDLSMLVILPDERHGLPAVEQSLRNVDLSTIAANLKMEMVTLRLPKFKIEFDLDMIDPLQRLGIRQIFSNNPQLGGFFKGNQPVGISKVQHKAFIEVNEAGSEAAAASFVHFIPLSLPPREIRFTADHPFMFAIRSPDAVYFIGHVVL